MVKIEFWEHKAISSCPNFTGSVGETYQRHTWETRETVASKEGHTRQTGGTYKFINLWGNYHLKFIPRSLRF
jgi:hypothetical protein